MVRLDCIYLAPLALVASAAAKTSLYLSPANNLAAPIGISAEEAHRILSHHIDVDGLQSKLGKESENIWSHVLREGKDGRVDVDQKAMVERLFDGHKDERNRLLVLMHGAAHDDIIPSTVQATHNIETAPASNSFDDLFDEYMASLSQTLKSSESALSHLTGTFMDGFTASLEWLTSQSKATAAKWSSLASPSKSAAFSKLHDELRSAEALLTKLETDESSESLSMQPLRFSSLRDVERTYGSDSEKYAEAKQLVRAAIEQITTLFQSRSDEQGRTASIAFIVTDDTDDKALVKRSTVDLLSPFLQPRASEQVFSFDSASSLKASPLPKNLAGSCFTDEAAFTKATNNCSGHGKAVKSTKGGKPCYRCQCKATEARKGKKVYWAGAACEKKDVSTEFVLLASSVLLLMLISMGSVYFLWAQGSDELPGTLASVTISLK